MSRGPTPPPPPLTPKPHWVFVKFSVATVGHQGLRSLHSMVRSFHLIGRLFHSFGVKLCVKCAFLASWLKELGIHMSNTLFSACGLKTCEKFWLYCGMMWLLLEECGLEWSDLDCSMKREEKCDIMLPWLQNFWISTTFKILWWWWMCPLKSNQALFKTPARFSQLTYIVTEGSEEGTYYAWIC